MKKAPVLAAILGITLGGCSGGGGSTAINTNDDGEILSVLTEGYTLPTEISAVPVDSEASVTGVRAASGFVSRIQTLVAGIAVADLPATSDYAKSTTTKFVDEKALKQFDIIEQVMKAAAQTHYDEEENINAGPYKAMIAWIDEGDGGREVKTLEPWVVDSRMIVLDGRDVNRVLVWIEEPDEENGGTRLVKAEFKIYTPAETNADGSYENYGEWDLNVAFTEDGSGFFVASSRVDGDVNTIMLHEREEDGDVRGILVRSGASGHGLVSHPDWDSCFGPGSDPENCVPPIKTAQYAYNSAYVAVDGDIGDGNVTPIYKDRDPDSSVEMTRRYGLFYADAGSDHAAGEDVQKTHTFGFPVSYVDDNSVRHFSYYGAWQGRHQLWGDSLEEGTTVVRQDRGPQQTAETYTASAPFNGTLTKRLLVEGELSDIQGIPVETWINKHYDLRFSGGAWEYCDGWVDWSNQNPTCMNFDGSQSNFQNFTDFGSLVVSPSDRKNVHIGRWDQDANQPLDYKYLAVDPQVAGVTYTVPGFYRVQQDQSTNFQPVLLPGGVYTPSEGDNLWVDIGGSIYVQYVGNFDGPVTTTGWVQKTLLSFDEQTWTPTFDPTGNSEFTPEPGRDYYINSRGANFVVKRKDDGAITSDSYEVMVELQSAANPVNYNSLLPPDTAYLRAPWRPEVRYSFDTDETDDNFLKLVYASDDPNTQDVDESTIETVLTSGEWGLRAYNDGADNVAGNDDDQPLMADGTGVTVDQWGVPTNPDQRPVEFNWEYSTDPNGWGVQRYLLDENGDYVVLDDPILLQPIQLTNGAGTTKTLALQFDGWMHGLPDLYFELSKNDWQMSSEISDKVINIPAGTVVTDAIDDSTKYYVKPLEVSVFLAEVPGTTPDLPDIGAADAVNLLDVPDFVSHGMGDLPTDVEVKYSEGKPVGGL